MPLGKAQQCLYLNNHAVKVLFRSATLHDSALISQVLSLHPTVWCREAMVFQRYGPVPPTMEGYFLIGESQGSSPTVCLVSSTLSALVVQPEHVKALAAELGARQPEITAVFGLRDTVHLLWQHLHSFWPTGEVRDQYAMASPAALHHGTNPLGHSLPSLDEDLAARGFHQRSALRLAAETDVTLTLRASADMFCHEVGFDPIHRWGRAYTHVVSSLISRRKTWIIRSQHAVIFKVDIPFSSTTHAHLQGIWVHPECRGMNICSTATAIVARQIALRGRVPALVVNESNLPARASYSSAGFSITSQVATVLIR